MNRTEQIRELRRTLATTTPAAVVDNDGLMIASALRADIEDDQA